MIGLTALTPRLSIEPLHGAQAIAEKLTKNRLAIFRTAIFRVSRHPTIDGNPLEAEKAVTP